MFAPGCILGGRRLAVREQEVEEFLDQAGQDDVANLADKGFPHAQERLHLRKNGVPSPPAEATDIADAGSRRAS